jgi:dipeptidyl aminopeptidase/acylaminoacyl peptidase
MRHCQGWFGSVTALLFGYLALPVFAAAPDPAPSFEAYGRLPSLEHVTLSPDGTRIALARTTETQHLVFVLNLADHKRLAAIDLGSAPDKLRSLIWADNNRLLIVASRTTALNFVTNARGEFFDLIGLDVVTGKTYDAMDFKTGVSDPGHGNFITSWPDVRVVNGETRVIVHCYAASGDAGELHPVTYSVSLDRRHGELLARDNDSLGYGLYDEAGSHIANAAYIEGLGKWLIRVRIGGRMRDILSGPPTADIPQLEGISPDGGSVWITVREAGVDHSRAISLQDGSVGPDLPDSAKWDQLLTDRISGRITVAISGRDYPQYHFFDPNLQRHWATLTAAAADLVPRLISANDGGSKFVVTASTETGPRYMDIDLDKEQIESIGSMYANIPSVAEVRPVSYSASDGLSISGYLTLPPARAATRLPLVVFPHGGPAARDTLDFDWWAQAMASQGYAVLQPNFRGSTVTVALEQAGYGQWGRKMQTDLSDGVHYLVAQGIVDPARVCIVGGSYGGYAALAGVVFEPSVYRCAVSVAGVSDLRQMFKWINTRHSDADTPAVRELERWTGVSRPEDGALDNISPARHAEAVQSPVLLIHGRDDSVVPYEQSTLMADALRKAGKPFEQVDLKKEDHWLSSSETRLQMLAATIAFLKVNNPP